nr:hypothetical protein CFP56_02493 [Quercus suber]
MRCEESGPGRDNSRYIYTTVGVGSYSPCSFFTHSSALAHQNEQIRAAADSVLAFSSVLAARLADVQAEPLRVEVHFVVALLQNAGNRPCVLELAQVNVRSTLLDRVTDELGRSGFTLGAHDHGLLFLPGLVHHERGTLGFLLSDLLGFDGGREFGRER